MMLHFGGFFKHGPILLLKEEVCSLKMVGSILHALFSKMIGFLFHIELSSGLFSFSSEQPN